MKRYFSIVDRKLQEGGGPESPVWLITAPTEEEQKSLLAELKIDEHTQRAYAINRRVEHLSRVRSLTRGARHISIERISDRREYAQELLGKGQVPF